MKKPKMIKKNYILLISFSILFLYFNYNLSITSLHYIISFISNIDINIITLSAEEGISTIFYLMSYYTLVIGFPIFFIILYFNFKDALYPKELLLFKKIPLLYLLGILGAIWGIFNGLYVMLPFMIKYNEILGLSATITLNNLVKTLLFNSLIFFIMFLIPAIIKNLVRYEVINRDVLRSKRKIIFFVCVVISGIVSPVELFTMFIILIPLYLCFELGIFFSQKRFI